MEIAEDRRHAVVEASEAPRGRAKLELEAVDGRDRILQCPPQTAFRGARCGAPSPHTALLLEEVLRARLGLATVVKRHALPALRREDAERDGSPRQLLVRELLRPRVVVVWPDDGRPDLFERRPPFGLIESSMLRRDGRAALLVWELLWRDGRARGLLRGRSSAGGQRGA